MEKLDLKLHHKYHNGRAGTLGMGYCFSALKESGLFNIDFHEDDIETARNMRGSILYCNDKKIYIDFWEYPAPTFTQNVFNDNFDLLIQMQHRDMPFENVRKYLNRKGMIKTDDENLQLFLDKMVPWTFFPSRLCEPYTNKEEELFCDEIDRLAFFCGKPWKCRHYILESIKDQGIEVIKSSQEKRSGKPLTNEQYLDYMRKSKYGIVLQGRASPVTDFKNRREADYMMMKKPLLLNYKPTYYNDFIEGEHFIYIDKNTDISKIEDSHDVDKIAENGYQWYLDNMQPQGAAKVFRKIMKDRFNF